MNDNDKSRGNGVGNDDFDYDEFLRRYSDVRESRKPASTQQPVRRQAVREPAPFDRRQAPQRAQPSASRRPGIYLDRKRKRRWQKQRLRLLVAALALVLLILIIVLICKSCGGKPTLNGLWSIDGVTKYEFVDEKNGAMVLPHGRFDFTYTVEDNIISIDFEDEHLRDSEYEFELTKDKLIFKSPVAEYEMTKEETD